MPPETSTHQFARHDGWGTLKRFLPYLWPEHDWRLRSRIIGALVLILLSTATQFALPYFLKWAIDAMNVTGNRVATFAMLFVLAYAVARLGGVVFDNLRNIVFEQVGQQATANLAENVFNRLHRLSLRFHLAAGRAK